MAKHFHSTGHRSITYRLSETEVEVLKSAAQFSYRLHSGGKLVCYVDEEKDFKKYEGAGFVTLYEIDGRVVGTFRHQLYHEIVP